MKKAILILLLVLFALVYYSGFFGNKETLPFSREFFSVETPNTKEWGWSLHKLSPANTKELDQLYQSKLDKGIRNIPLLSLFLIREAEQARKEGDKIQAVRIGTYAVKFSPDLHQPYFELARALWAENPLQLHKVLYQVYQGWRAKLHHYPSSLKLFYNSFYLLAHALLMTFIIFGIVIIVKYYPLYFYGIRKSLSQEISVLLINSLKIFVLFVPFFLRLDLLWAILFWTILLWGYVTKRERQFIAVFLVILVYFPFFLRSASTFLDSPSSDILLEIHETNHEDWDKATGERLRSWLTSHPEDSDVLFSLGLMEKREGRYAQAEEFFKRALQKDSKAGNIHSNLGNVYLASKQPDLAVASYQQAINLDPRQASYYFNLYRAYSQQTFISRNNDKAYQRARQLDSKLIDYYDEIDVVNRPPNLNRLVIDEVLTTSQLWNRFLNEFIGREGPLFRLFKAWFERIPSRLPFLAPILFLGFLIGMSRYSRTRRFLTRCPMCGSPTYRFYLGEKDQDFVCFNCYRIFIQKEKLHPKITEKKSLQVRRFQKENHLISRFLSFLLVGFGDLWEDRPLKGMFFLFLFFIFILRFIYWNGMLASPYPPSFSSFWEAVLWGVLFLLFYLFALRKVVRARPAPVAEN